MPVRTYFSRSATYGWSFILSVPDTEAGQVDLGAPCSGSCPGRRHRRGVCAGGAPLTAHRPPGRSARGGGSGSRARREVPSRPPPRCWNSTRSRTLSPMPPVDLRDRSRSVNEALAQIAESEARLQLALNAGNLGSWEYHAVDWDLHHFARMPGQFRPRPDEPFSYADLVASIHPEDRAHAGRGYREGVVGAHGSSCGVPRDLARRERALDSRQRPHAHGRGRAACPWWASRRTSRSASSPMNGRPFCCTSSNHRVKNTLATVQSVASMTRRSAAERAIRRHGTPSWIACRAREDA